MRRKYRINSIILCLGLIFVLWSVAPATDISNFTSGQTMSVVTIAGDPHDPIVIDGDDNFIEIASNEGWGGDGSEGDPIIIEGYDIDLGGAAGHCISISNTRVNFTISDCILTEASINPGSGIYLNNVSFANIIGNTAFNNYHGILLEDCDINTISDNICHDNTATGIYLLNSESNTLTDNTCYSNTFGHLVEYSNHNILINSECYGHIDGIRLMNSHSNTLNNNTCYTNTQNGIFMSAASEFNTLANNTCYLSNYGIRVSNSISNTLTNNSCYENNQSGIYLYNSNQTSLTDNNCFDNAYHGIYLSLTESNTLGNNTCYLNSLCGIQLLNTDYSDLINNTCSFNQWGIAINSSDFNFISKNTCYDNDAVGITIISSTSNTLDGNVCNYSMFGIILESTNFNTLIDNTFNENINGVYFYLFSAYNFLTFNTITGNGEGIHMEVIPNNYFTYNILSNTVNALDDIGTNNKFEHNYWDDYDGFDLDGDGIGENPYYFTSNSDPYPLTYLPTRPIFQETPKDIVLEYGFSDFELDLNATCPTTVTWYVNDTLFNIDCHGIITSGLLQIGKHALTVVASNIYGFGTSVSFSVTIVDTTAPSWIIIPIEQTLEYNEALVYQVAATDLSGIDYWELSDTVNFGINEYGVITNNTILSPGVYPLLVTVYDTHGNDLSESITISVNDPEDTTPPAWVTLIIHQSFEYGEMVEIQVEAWDASGIHHLWLNYTALFTIDAFGIITNTSTLDPGIYTIEVRAYDPSDNFCTAVIIVTILEPEVIPTVTVTTTIVVTVPVTTYPIDGLTPVITLTVGAGIGGISVLILVVLFLKKRPSS